MKTKSILIAIISTLLFCQITSAREAIDHPHLHGHLSFKQNTLHIHAGFVTTPIVGPEVVLNLEAKDAKTHLPKDINDTIEVALWMPSMGHGSAPTQVERAVDATGNLLPGVFVVRNVYFTMGGEWEVRVTLIDSDGIQETQIFKVSLEGDPHDHSRNR